MSLSDVQSVLPGNDYRELIEKKEQFNASFSLPVSIVIPFYKGGEILARTLASLVRQTYPHQLFEVVISDDGGVESIDHILDFFAESLNLKYIRREDRGYCPATARNIGMQEAMGEVIISLDFDMICQPDFIHSHLVWFHIADRVATIGPRKFIDAHRLTLDDVLSRFTVVSQLPTITSVSNEMREADERVLLFDNFYDHPLPSNYFYSCNVAYRKREALAIGGFDEQYNSHYGYEDIDFGHRLWLSGTFLVLELAALAYHQENTVVPLQERRDGKTINRQKLYNKFPEFMHYRRSISLL